MRFRKITVAGVGLLGGSIGLGVKSRGLASRVEGLVRREESVSNCLRLGVVDGATTAAVEAARDADLIVLCTPLGQMRPVLEAMLPGIQPGSIVTDVGSVKESLVEELDPIAKNAGVEFIGSHPMAGSERTGADWARADLFEKAVCVVTPTPESTRSSVEQVEGFWRDLGGIPVRLQAAAHDELVSRSSHLPHVIASALVRQVLSANHPGEQALLCATGFRDTTRIASGSPEVWRDIARANRRNLAESLNAFIQELQAIRRALEANDTAALESFFQSAKQLRDEWTAESRSAA